MLLRRRLLPWDYGLRNLLRRPTRTLLTLIALTTVVLLVLVVVGFLRGLEESLTASGDDAVVLAYSLGAGENIESSAIAACTPSLLAASLEGVQNRFGLAHVSPELYLGTRVQDAMQTRGGLGLIRGVTTAAPLVRRRVRIVEGKWPGRGEVIVGKLAAAKLGFDSSELAIGKPIRFEQQNWRISGLFTADGAAFESEIWCNLAELQQALKRQDISLVAILMQPGTTTANVELFCKQRTDLELQAIGETKYYESLQQHYKPVRMLAWLVVVLVAGAGAFAGLNMMYGAIAGRTREIAMLQAIGYRQWAILVSLVQESTLLAAGGCLGAGFLALMLLNGAAVRFTMGAFTLRVDGVSLLIGSSIGLMLGVFGAIPPAIKALRLPVATSLKPI